MNIFAVPAEHHRQGHPGDGSIHWHRQRDGLPPCSGWRTRDWHIAVPVELPRAEAVPPLPGKWHILQKELMNTLMNIDCCECIIEMLVWPVPSYFKLT